MTKFLQVNRWEMVHLWHYWNMCWTCRIHVTWPYWRNSKGQMAPCSVVYLRKWFFNSAS